MSKFIKQNLFLILILVLSLFLRLWGVNFGLPRYFFHTDETYALWKAQYFFYPALRSADGVTIFHLFLNLYRHFLALFIGSDKEVGYLFILGGRVISGLLSTGSVLITYLLAKKIFRSKLALISALILATTFVDVQVAHYLRQDPYIQFFGLLFTLLYLRKNRHLLFYAFLIGLISSLRFTALIYLVPMFMVYWRNNSLSVFKKTRYLFFSVIICFLGFVAGHPAAFFVEHDPIGYVRLYYNFITKNSFSQVGIDSSNGVTSTYWWLRYLTTTGLFYSTFVYFVVGLTTWSISMARRIKKTNPLEIGIILATLLYFVALFVKPVRFDRYLIPITPFIVIVATYTLYRISNFFRGKLVRGLVLASLLLLVIVPNFVRVALFDNIISQKDTREEAVDWIRENYNQTKQVLTVGNAIQIGNELYYGRGYNNVINLFPFNEQDILSKYPGKAIVVDLSVVHSTQNYPNTPENRDFVKNYNLLKEEGSLLKVFNKPFFSNEFFGKFDMEISSTVNVYHNPTIEIYKIPEVR